MVSSSAGGASAGGDAANASDSEGSVSSDAEFQGDSDAEDEGRAEDDAPVLNQVVVGGSFASFDDLKKACEARCGCKLSNNNRMENTDRAPKWLKQALPTVSRFLISGTLQLSSMRQDWEMCLKPGYQITPKPAIPLWRLKASTMCCVSGITQET